MPRVSWGLGAVGLTQGETKANPAGVFWQSVTDLLKADPQFVLRPL